MVHRPHASAPLLSHPPAFLQISCWDNSICFIQHQLLLRPSRLILLCRLSPSLSIYLSLHLCNSISVQLSCSLGLELFVSAVLVYVMELNWCLQSERDQQLPILFPRRSYEQVCHGYSATVQDALTGFDFLCVGVCKFMFASECYHKTWDGQHLWQMM